MAEADDSTAVPNRRVNIAGIGRVLMWNGGSLWIGHRAGRSTMHAHHAIQLSFALAGHFQMKSARQPAWSRYTAALVRPNERHQFDGCDTSMAQIFVEPETQHGRALLALHPEGDVVALSVEPAGSGIDALAGLYRARAADSALIEAARHCIATLAGQSVRTTPPIDPRVERVLAELRARVAHPVALADAAAWVHLSPSRFRHVFAEHVGSSFRAYLLWLRLNAAVERAMAGATWTEAAHHAGFADSPHLTRTFRRMFGFVPVMLIKE